MAQLSVIHDGSCGVCRGLAGWLARRDRCGRFRMLVRGSPEAAAVLSAGGVPPPGPDALLVVKAGRVLVGLPAVRAVAEALPWPWRLGGWLLRVIPRPLAGWAYGRVARWRHILSRSTGTCPFR